MFIQTSSTSHGRSSDIWINTDHIIRINFRQDYAQFNLGMIDGTEEQVGSVSGIRAIEKFLGCEPHDLGGKE